MGRACSKRFSYMLFVFHGHCKIVSQPKAVWISIVIIFFNFYQTCYKFHINSKHGEVLKLIFFHK